MILIIGLYVDDNVIVGHRKLIHWGKKQLSSRFPMKDLGPVHSILGIQVNYDRFAGVCTLQQTGFILEILSCYGMNECNSCATPMEEGLQLPKLARTHPDHQKLPYREAVGKLLWVALGTRPDIAFAVNYLSRFVAAYSDLHWKALMRVLRYLRGTASYGIQYSRHVTNPLALRAYGDADWGGDKIDRRSITGYLFMLAGGPISWRTRKQNTVALSSTEAEYLSATDSSKQAVYHRNFLQEIGIEQTGPTVIHADNQGAIALSENPCKHERTKHFDIRHHFIREKVQAGEVLLRYCPTNEMVADLLTKALPRIKFEKFRREAGISKL